MEGNKKKIICIPQEWVERNFPKLLTIELSDKEKLSL